MKMFQVMPLFKRYRASQSGVAAIEMAFILPFMMIMFFGLIDVTSLVSTNRQVTAISSAVADLVGQNRTTVFKSSIDDYFKVVDLVFEADSVEYVKVRVAAYRKTGSTVNRIWVVDNENGEACPREPDTAGMLALMEANNDLVVAQTCARFKPFLANFFDVSIFGADTIQVQQDITLRPRSTLTLACQMSSSNSAACGNT
jgi:Flp pilus assembly protein TadG